MGNNVQFGRLEAFSLENTQGRTQGRARGARRPKKHQIFRVSLVKLRDLRLSNTCSQAFCYVEGPRKPVAW